MALGAVNYEHMKTPLFTVVVPVYNKAPHILRCLQSVANQDFVDYEVVIVDDASTDGSSKLLEEFIHGSGYLLIKREKPGPGGYAARNLAIENAKGAYIAFLDADDEWHSDHLTRTAKSIGECPGAVIYCSAYEINNRGVCMINSYAQHALSKGIHRVDFGQFLRLYATQSRLFHTSVAVVEKTRLKAMGGFPEGRTDKGGDLYTWVSLMHNSYAVWSPHRGATVYTDAVNKVTQTAFFNPALIRAMFDELENCIGRGDEVLLKRYVNYLLLKDYLRCAVRTGRRGFSLPRYTLHTSLGHYVRIVALYLIPPKLIRLLHLCRKQKYNEA